ncbi:ATPase [Leisingera aquaemixtae]|uniref:ATPase n=1 Tax=Leisingera aquaemixtae TaxID=1396826 RepID=UPI0021A6F54F|nr:ATPase [Leisingera aquaemixtae]UWQ26642.1 ATPase [Leisingera aquaemixtae]UWQ44089.1 ATPase [Leisingera aquaemixtae]
MLYSSAQDWRAAPNKRVLFFGMSGLGKTYVSNVLRGAGSWFHYSVDYRIGTRYMGEYIADNAKAEAMKVPFLRELLLSDSIFIGSNITFENLTPVAAYLGKPGDVAKGGLPIAEYKRRQEQFRVAEIRALLDTEYFEDRAQQLYGYPNFICDTGGSICEWVDVDDPQDQIMSELSKHTLMVWIKGTDAHTEELVRRFDRAPKPMSYQPEFLDRVWQEYLKVNGIAEGDVDPDAFIRWTYAQALAHRQPRYQAMADNWGITVTADQISAVKDEAGFVDLIASALEARS